MKTQLESNIAAAVCLSGIDVMSDCPLYLYMWYPFETQGSYSRVDYKETLGRVRWSAITQLMVLILSLLECWLSLILPHFVS
jgi:cytochrome c oxidase subunit IV